jgi:hypothetical protein
MTSSAREGARLADVRIRRTIFDMPRNRNVNKAWETAVLHAYGHEPEWVRRVALAPASRAQLDVIDLHFHDLRQEGGCRWLEQGWPIHHVQEMWGHSNLSQTSKPAVAKDT